VPPRARAIELEDELDQPVLGTVNVSAQRADLVTQSLRAHCMTLDTGWMNSIAQSSINRNG
jgi:hypothetical protein